MSNETFIKLVLERNNQTRKRKRDKIKIFIWLLIKEKKIYDSNLVNNYCFAYYDCCKNVVYEAVEELKKEELIKTVKNLLDARKKLLFMC